MKRRAISQLFEWKNRPNRKPLIIRGARQVGKTWLMKEFASKSFEKFYWCPLKFYGRQITRSDR